SDWIDGPVGVGGQPQAISEPVAFLDDVAMRPENQQELPRAELERFALDLINFERAQMGAVPLRWDELAARLAHDHVDDLCLRRAISHASRQGDNPDRRYTLAGGNDALIEGLASVEIDQPSLKKLNKGMIARVLKTLISHQDDRDALLSPEATDFAISISYTDLKDRLIGCTET